MSHRLTSHSLEVLEARIAPAALLLKSSGVVKYATPPPSLAGIAAGAGADLAVVLEAGDVLYLDVNNDNKAAGDPILVADKTGRSLIFLTDLDHSHTYSANEITGLRVSNNFNGTIFTSVHGSVVTGLNATPKTVGNPALKMNLAGLTVTGKVDGSILASGSVANVVIAGILVDGGSVGEIRTGSEALNATYSLGATPLAFTGTPGAGVHDITGVALAHGAALVAAGAGGDVTNVTLARQSTDLSIRSGAGLDGVTGAGSITNLRVDSITTAGLNFDLRAQGGFAGSGAAGGSLTNVTIVLDSSVAAGSVTAEAGHGANGSAGGKGGSIANLSLFASSAGAVTLEGGQGGAGAVGAGGAGGSVLGVAPGLSSISGASGVTILGGAGGPGGNANGGAGGSISGLQISGLQDGAAATFTAGAGALGGAGGSLAGIHVNGGFNAALAMVTGTAGAGKSGGNISDFSAGAMAVGRFTLTAGQGFSGDGGSLTAIVLHSLDGAPSSTVSLSAGQSGAGTGSAAGGSGGGFANLQLDHVLGFDLVAADGSTGSVGGNGGTVAGVTLSAVQPGAVFDFTGGTGAKATVNGAGGNGGDVSGVSISSAASASFTAGDAGDGSDAGAASVGGRGGAVSNVKVAAGEDDGSFNFTAGNAGSGLASQGSAGNVSGLSVGGGALAQIIVTAGQVGEQAFNSAAAGRAGGSVLGVIVTAASLSALEITAQDGGFGGISFSGVTGAIQALGSGGAGGSISDLHLLTSDGGTNVTLTAGSGGDSGDPTRGTGGDGGSVGSAIPAKGIELRHVGDVEVMTGHGGSGSVGGNGGAFRNVTVSHVADDAILNASTGAGGGGFTAPAAGGLIASITVADGAWSSIALTTGGGNSPGEGSAAHGGDAGDISAIHLNVTSLGSLNLATGDGADGGSVSNFNGDIVNGGAGGSGGSIGDLVLSAANTDVGTALTITAGQGGSGQALLAGGAGGSVSGLALDHLGDVAITAGAAGSAQGSGPGGLGGSIFNLTKFSSSGDVTLTAGLGGSGSNGGAGGAGGSIYGLVAQSASFTILGGTLNLTAGQGGNGSAGINAAGDTVIKSGAGGAGGSVQRFLIDASQNLDATESDFGFVFVAGDGGLGGGKAAGGKGGSATDLTISAAFGLSQLSIIGGAGGATDGFTLTALGGAGGSVAKITVTGLDTIAAVANIVGGAGGTGDGGDGLDGTSTGVTLNGAVLPP